MERIPCRSPGSARGVDVNIVEQPPKYRYVYLLRKGLIDRLRVAVLPYPKADSGEDKQ